MLKGNCYGRYVRRATDLSEYALIEWTEEDGTYPMQKSSSILITEEKHGFITDNTYTVEWQPLWLKGTGGI
jgi:hypothetical protein